MANFVSRVNGGYMNFTQAEMQSALGECERCTNQSDRDSIIKALVKVLLYQKQQDAAKIGVQCAENAALKDRVIRLEAAAEVAQKINAQYEIQVNRVEVLERQLISYELKEIQSLRDQKRWDGAPEAAAIVGVTTVGAFLCIALPPVGMAWLIGAAVGGKKIEDDVEERQRSFNDKMDRVENLVKTGTRLDVARRTIGV